MFLVLSDVSHYKHRLVAASYLIQSVIGIALHYFLKVR